MRPKIETILPKLAPGHYLLTVTKNGGTSSLQISEDERTAIMEGIRADHCDRRPRAFEPGQYVIDIEGGWVTAMGVSPTDMRRIITDVLGAEQ